MSDPVADLLDRVKRLQRDVDQLQRDRQRPYLVLRDTGDRQVRLGLQDDGTWGLRMWDTAGVLILDETAA